MSLGLQRWCAMRTRCTIRVVHRPSRLVKICTVATHLRLAAVWQSKAASVRRDLCETVTYSRLLFAVLRNVYLKSGGVTIAEASEPRFVAASTILTSRAVAWFPPPRTKSRLSSNFCKLTVSLTQSVQNSGRIKDKQKTYKMLSYRRETALQGAL